LTTVLFATVAIGIGGYAAVAAFTNGLFAGSVGVRDSRGVVTVVWHAGADRILPVPYDAFVTLSGRTSSFASLAAFRESRVSVSLDGRTAWMTTAEAMPDIWKILRVTPVLGNMALASDRKSGVIDVVLAYRAWQDEFAARQDIVGAAIVVDGRHGRIVAVAPSTFEGVYVGRPIDLWVPLAAGPRLRTVSVLGQLRRGTDLDAAQQQVTSIVGAEPGATLLPYSGVEPEARAGLARLERVLSWAAMLVLLIAAANVAGFLLSRAARRSHETAARVALGATRGRLASQIAAESLLVCVGGGIFAVVVGFWTASVMPALLYSEDAEHLVLAPHVWQIAATAATYTIVMFVCALAPLAEIDRHGAMTALRQGGAAVTQTGWLRSMLVIVQMGACVVLVIAAALLLQNFRGSLRSVRGDRIGEPVVATLEAAALYANESAGRRFFGDAERQVLGVPHVGGVAWVAMLPGGRSYDSAFRAEPAPLGWTTVAVDTMMPPGRDLLALKLTSGRPFGGQDGPASCRVALVNEAAATRYFAGSALGRSFRDSGDRRVDIVGVVQARKSDAVPRVYYYDRQTGKEPTAVVNEESIRIPVDAPPAQADLDVNIASPGYFDTIGATFGAGHNFDEPSACDVAIVNGEAARTYFDGRAVGGAVIDPDGRRAEIVGVVDAGVLHLMQRRAEPTVYFPMSRRFAPQMTLVAQTRTAPPAMLAEIELRLRTVPGARQPPSVSTLEDRLSRTALGPERIAAVVVSTSAAIALGLGLLGVYGVMSDAVLQRKREIAIRLALGAQSWRIVGSVVGEGVRIALAGGSAGLAAAWAVVLVVRHVEPGTAAPPLWVWAAGPLTLGGVVAIASVFPARWALAVDPLTLTREG
jgi:hypothetical protein